MDSLRLLVITDIHYSSNRKPPKQLRRRSGIALTLVRKAIEEAKRLGGFEAMAILGDIVNDATEPNAPADLAAVRDGVAAGCQGTPLLIISGNHDDPDDMRAVFGLQAGAAVQTIGGYRFMTFQDGYAAGDYCIRPQDQRGFMADLAASGEGILPSHGVPTTGETPVELTAGTAVPPGGPIIALQHNPIHPLIGGSTYPFMLVNRSAVVEDYAKAGVLLSISGHYHAGQELTQQDGVSYVTAPALCEAPFEFAVVTLTGRGVQVRRHSLQLPARPALVDCHAHTQYAYCGRGLDAPAEITLAQDLGLSMLCLVEHAPQLYCGEEDFFAGRHIREPRLWRESDGRRMAEFRRDILPLRAPGVLVGLEVEIDSGGSMTLRDEDRQGLDLLVGAVHFMPRESSSMTDPEMASEFMWVCEQLMRGGVDILAHPWRVFPWSGREVPRHLYGELADMLARYGVAAEINLHKNQNDIEFFRACIARGVKIATGSDSHGMHQVAALQGHLEILRAAAGREDVDDLLWRPKGAK